MAHYKVSRKAAEDLFQIGIYTEEEWGVNQRNNYLDEIEQKFQLLANNPNLPYAKNRNDIREGCFSILVNEHMIIYRKFSYGVRIIRVLHQSMDIQRKL